MNPMKVKPLVQVKESEAKMQVYIHLLITRETLQEMIDSIDKGKNMHLQMSLPAIDAEVVVEGHEPGKSAGLLYSKQLQRNDWNTLVASVL